MTPTLVFVGGGPRTVSLLERLAANAGPLRVGAVDVHVVDPYPAGGGHIWRRAQSPLLWMNSTTEDVTLFTDDSVACDGPIVPGPTLHEWITTQPVPQIGRNDFASREIQSGYLRWAFDRAVADLPAGWRVTEHRQAAVDVVDLGGGRQRVTLADGVMLDADVVVLAQGYLARRPTAVEQDLLDSAAAHGLRYIPPAFTADLDLSELPAGENVIIRGFGLAFVDLMVLLAEGRGGQFAGPNDALRYQPSGAEPVLWVGSRRGVPYHAKLGYRRPSGPAGNRYLTSVIRSGDGLLDYERELWPLVVKELTFAHHQELFSAHSDRTAVDWPAFSAVIDDTDVRSAEFRAAEAAAVPDPRDHFDLARIDHPFVGAAFPELALWEKTLVDHIEADLDRRADPAYSADSAVFDQLLAVYGGLAEAVVRQRISPQDRIRCVEGSFHSLFSFLASGPPPRRLAELLALHRAGVVRFLGPETTVRLEEGRFVAAAPAFPDTVTARTLIDGFLPHPDVRTATDPIISGLSARGELAAEDIRADDGTPLPGGQLLADTRCRAIDAAGASHPRRFLLGPSVSGSAGSAGFARPGFNSPGLRQNDQVARDLLDLLRTSPEQPGEQHMSTVETTYLQELHRWRAARETDLQQPYGVQSPVSLHWLTDTPTSIPGLPGVFSGDADTVTAAAAATDGLVTVADGTAVDGELTVAVPEASSVAWLLLGDLQLEALRRGGRPALRVRDPQAGRRDVELVSFPVDPRWVLTGTYTALDPHPVTVDTAVDGLRQDVRAVGVLRLELDGDTVDLVATGAPQSPAITFADATSGRESAAWRNVAVQLGDNGTATVDFNRAVNPPFTFSVAGTCPAPVPENRLAVAVTAGEKARL